MGYTKKALIRREGYPMGQIAPVFLRCICGHELDMNFMPDTIPAVTCTCGRTWDETGWLTNADSASISGAAL